MDEGVTDDESESGDETTTDHVEDVVYEMPDKGEGEGEGEGEGAVAEIEKVKREARRDTMRDTTEE